jgi:predicted acyl esterase
MNFLRLGNRTLLTGLADHVSLVDLNVYRRLPLISALDDLGDRPFYREMVRHNTYDEFWSSYSMKHRYAEVGVPAYFMSGWYDNLPRFRCSAPGGAGRHGGSAGVPGC